MHYGVMLKMKALIKLVFVGGMAALIFYACSPSSYSGDRALNSLQGSIRQSVNAEASSALGYSSTVRDSNFQYYKVVCSHSELLRLVDVLDLEASYSNHYFGGDFPKWFVKPKDGSEVYGRDGFVSGDFGSRVSMWHSEGNLFVHISFWD